VTRRAGGRFAEGVEVDFSHAHGACGAASGPASRKSISRGTGRPCCLCGSCQVRGARDVQVGPAQPVRELGEEACGRNGAAVASAGIGEVGEVALELLVYSSAIGMCQQRSSARRPAAVSSPASSSSLLMTR